MKEKEENLIAQNKKARHDYFIKETLEAGIALTGTEIKSVRARRINLRDGYVQIINGSAYLENVHISEYKQGNRYNHDPLRSRRLLLHKKEINRFGKSPSRTRNSYNSVESLFKARFCQSIDWCWSR